MADWAYKPHVVPSPHGLSCPEVCGIVTSPNPSLPDRALHAELVGHTAPVLRFALVGAGPNRGWRARNTALERGRLLRPGRNFEYRSMERWAPLWMDPYPSSRTCISQRKIRIRAGRSSAVCGISACQHSLRGWFQSSEPEVEFCHARTRGPLS